MVAITAYLGDPTSVLHLEAAGPICPEGKQSFHHRIHAASGLGGTC
jgi:hypothetical protein